MSHPYRVFLAVLLVGMISPMALATELLLIQDGKPMAVVVVPNGGDAGAGAAMTAAKVLVDHLSQMSGAKLEIRPVGDLGNAVVLNGVVSAEAGKVDATIKSFIFIGDSALAKQAGFSSEGLEQGGILVKSDGNALALIGSA